jgi:hypothetical protein
MPGAGVAVLRCRSTGRREPACSLNIRLRKSPTACAAGGNAALAACGAGRGSSARLNLLGLHFLSFGRQHDELSIDRECSVGEQDEDRNSASLSGSGCRRHWHDSVSRSRTFGHFEAGGSTMPFSKDMMRTAAGTGVAAASFIAHFPSF